MQLSAKTQNACLALLELAKRIDNPQPVCLKTISDAQDISSQFLVQILLQLKRAGLVNSTRGASGGYRLAMPPADISLLDIVTAMEGMPPAVPTSDNATASVFFDTWSEITDEHCQRLSGTSLETMCAKIESQHASDMYYI